MDERWTPAEKLFYHSKTKRTWGIPQATVAVRTLLSMPDLNEPIPKYLLNDDNFLSVCVAKSHYPCDLLQLIAKMKALNPDKDYGWIIHRNISIDAHERPRAYMQLGMDPNTTDNDGNTFLHLTDNPNRLLQDQALDYGTDPNKRNKNGDTPLMLPKATVKNKLSFIRRGASANLKDTEGRSILYMMLSEYHSSRRTDECDDPEVIEAVVWRITDLPSHFPETFDVEDTEDYRVMNSDMYNEIALWYTGPWLAALPGDVIRDRIKTFLSATVDQPFLTDKPSVDQRDEEFHWRFYQKKQSARTRLELRNMVVLRQMKGGKNSSNNKEDIFILEQLKALAVKRRRQEGKLTRADIRLYGLYKEKYEETVSSMLEITLVDDPKSVSQTTK